MDRLQVGPAKSQAGDVFEFPVRRGAYAFRPLQFAADEFQLIDIDQ